MQHAKTKAKELLEQFLAWYLWAPKEYEARIQEVHKFEWEKGYV